MTLFSIVFFFCVTLLATTFSCPDRNHTMTCFYTQADTNNDGRVSKQELQNSLDDELPWWKRQAFHLFGGIGRIMKDCDKNGDGFLTIPESFAMSETCMESCYKIQSTKDLFTCS